MMGLQGALSVGGLLQTKCLTDVHVEFRLWSKSRTAAYKSPHCGSVERPHVADSDSRSRPHESDLSRGKASGTCIGASLPPGATA